MKQFACFKKIGKVLDIGIGDGYLLEKLGCHFELYGIDISALNIQKTQAIFTEKKIVAHLKEGCVDGIPFPDNMFDFVIASDVIEHVDDETLLRGIKEIYRVLKTGGYFIGTVPANENLHDNTVYCPNCHNTFHRWGHQQTFDVKKIKSIFSGQGFRVRNIKRITFFGALMNLDTTINKLKFHVGKMLFGLFKRIFAPQWWLFFKTQKMNK
ncbi:MAG: methyltransferase domain-containing protein [Nitrospirota bacterium]